MIKSSKKFWLLSLFGILLIAGAVYYLKVRDNAHQAAPLLLDNSKADSAGQLEPELKFGLPVDSFTVIDETVQRNEFLSDILTEYGVDLTSIANLAQKSKPIFNVRDIRAGNDYTVFCTKDSSQKAQYFVYQLNPVDYIVYDLRDSVRIYKGQREVVTRQRTVSGVINSSLYETLEKNSGDPALAIKLANVFAWTIDFYAIQAGDWFKVIYEERLVHDNPVEPGNIIAASFSHKGEIFQAYYFQPDSSKPGDYYDEKGHSLRRAFLKAPLKFSRISSRYTLHRFHPVQKRWKAHLGTDYAAPTGTPIYSTGNGVVIASQYTRFNGNYVKIRHNSVYTTQYLHMSRRAVKAGQHVRQGQLIGYVGMTGLATGPHVCYRFWKNGRQVDPLREKFPSAEPIVNSEKPAFDSLMVLEKSRLDKIVLKELASAK